MKLTPKDIEQFKEIMCSEFQIILSDIEAEEYATQVLKFLSNYLS